MKRWPKTSLKLLLAISLCAAVYAVVLKRAPVLFHWNGSCVCTDYSPEVEGFSIFNPFRSREPERRADEFLRDLSQQKCPPAAATQAMTSAACREPFPPFAWELKHREDQPHKVRLYFAFKRLSDGPDSSYSGEGVVELVDTEGGWKADMTDGLGIW